jgi:hypothetical protein
VSRAYLRLAARLDVLVRTQPAGRSALVKLVVGVLAARGLIGTAHSDG